MARLTFSLLHVNELYIWFCYNDFRLAKQHNVALNFQLHFHNNYNPKGKVYDFASVNTFNDAPSFHMTCCETVISEWLDGVQSLS